MAGPSSTSPAFWTNQSVGAGSPSAMKFHSDLNCLMDPAANNKPLKFYPVKNKHSSGANSYGRDPEIQGSVVGSSEQMYEKPEWKKNQERGCIRDRSWTKYKENQERIKNNDYRNIERERNFKGDSPPNQPYSMFAAQSSNACSRPVPMIQHGSPGMIPAMDPSQWPLNPSSGINPLTFMGISGDPNFLGVMSMASFGQFGLMRPPEAGMMMGPIVEEPLKDIIHTNSCVLYPPKPNAPPQTTRQRPPGCRTAFVGGLPENSSEEIIREIFDRCGEISTVRMSKKNFCHVRFENESSVDNAVFLSGYRVKIGDKDDSANTGRLHVDYAHARDDQFEWECYQRAVQREMRHRERLEQERLHPPSPPPVVHYSDHEAALLIEKLRGEETFQKAVQILITWLERGECSKRNACHFYIMIQSTNSHVRRLMSEKNQYEEELRRAKQLLKQRMQGIFIQFNQIQKVFVAASHQKVWDHFTKPQRKNIDLWKKLTEEIKNAQLEEVLNEREEDEMELSDDEPGSPPIKKSYSEDDVTNSNSSWQEVVSTDNDKLREENDTLRCQLEAYRNEVDVLRAESQHDLDVKDQQLHALQKALQNVQHQLMSLSRRHASEEEKLDSSEKSDKKDEGEHEENEEKLEDIDKDHNSNNSYIDSSSVSSSSVNFIAITEKEAQLIGVISTFLHVHPFGAGVDYIWSYLHQLENSLHPRDVEALMMKFPSVFKQGLSGVGATLERRWTFCGFKKDI